MRRMIAVLMGVSGSGKTTIGERVAQRLDWRFIDADDHHPAANVAKMSAGIPLDDNALVLEANLVFDRPLDHVRTDAVAPLDLSLADI